jgi:hypothetical protein
MGKNKKRRIVTDEEARAIRKSDKKNVDLAREYGYDKSTISKIRSS